MGEPSVLVFDYLEGALDNLGVCGDMDGIDSVGKMLHLYCLLGCLQLRLFEMVLKGRYELLVLWLFIESRQLDLFTKQFDGFLGLGSGGLVAVDVFVKDALGLSFQLFN